MRGGLLLVLGSVSGLLAGGASWLFLTVLEHLTQERLARGGLMWFLPLAGLVVGATYHYLGGQARKGNGLLVEEILVPRVTPSGRPNWVPVHMAPMILLFTWMVHLFGGSAGREGTALQMSGGLTDNFARLVQLRGETRRMLLAGSLAAGFGAVIGVPAAGAVFAARGHTCWTASVVASTFGRLPGVICR